MKRIYQTLILIVSLTVLSVWTFRMNSDSIFRGGGASNMLEEFRAYGLTETHMYIVGAFKMSAAILLLLGLRFRNLIIPGAVVMTAFMIGAVTMHVRIGDGPIPTGPSTIMLASCLLILFLHRRIYSRVHP